MRSRIEKRKQKFPLDVTMYGRSCVCLCVIFEVYFVKDTNNNNNNNNNNIMSWPG